MKKIYNASSVTSTGQAYVMRDPGNMVKNINKLYARALYESLEGKNAKETEKIVSIFLDLLKKKGDLHRIQKVVKEFEELYNQKNGICKLKISSAFPLEEKTVEKIAKKLDVKDYELETKIEKNLIGGYVARYGDNLIDASVKNNLKKLTSILSS